RSGAEASRKPRREGECVAPRALDRAPRREWVCDYVRGREMKDPQVRLDHVGVAIRDLARGHPAYERLGFKLTPRSIHRGSPAPGAPVIPFGSGNHCAMFREGYLEIVGLTDPAIYSNIKP